MKSIFVAVASLFICSNAFADNSYVCRYLSGMNIFNAHEVILVEEKSNKLIVSGYSNGIASTDDKWSYNIVVQNDLGVRASRAVDGLAAAAIAGEAFIINNSGVFQGYFVGINAMSQQVGALSTQCKLK
jgi:hypothetical protein